MQAIVEQYHTEGGIRWPLTLSPYLCVVIPVNLEHQKDAVDFVLAVNEWCPAIPLDKMFVDNRYKSKMTDRQKEAELLGASHIILIGKQWMNDSQVQLIVNTNRRPYYRADKTLETLKEYFQAFSEELQTPFSPSQAVESTNEKE